MVATKQGVLAVCQASEGVSLEVPSRLLWRPGTHDSIDGPLGQGRNLQAQGSTKSSHSIRIGHYKVVSVLARSVVLNHDLTISNKLRFHFSVSAFLQLGATYPASLRISPMITVP